MAIFRKIHTSFWSDSFISELDRDKKLFYIYLLTNEKTSQCGIYEITKKQIAFDLGYSIDTVSKLLLYFIKKGKIKYNENTKELALKNWDKFNKSTSPKVQSCVNKELKDIKDRLLIEYIYSIDTASQQEQEEEEEQEQEQEKSKKKRFTPPIVEDVILYFEQNGYKKEAAIKAFNYYNVANWFDSKGNKIKSWKQKMQGVWFKPENKDMSKQPKNNDEKVRIICDQFKVPKLVTRSKVEQTAKNWEWTNVQILD